MWLQKEYNLRRFAFVIFLCTFLHVQGYAQVTKQQLLSSYIYQFSNHVTWPGNTQKVFTITLITDSEDLFQNLLFFAKKKEINGLRFQVAKTNQLDNSLLSSNVIFVSEEYAHLYIPLYDMAEGKPILLISENLMDKGVVMLNIYNHTETEIRFEINKPNIINQKLIPSDEILVLGGTEIDVVSLFLKSQRTLRSMERLNEKYRNELDSVQQLIAASEEMLNQQKIFLTHQFQEIENQKMLQEAQMLKVQQYEEELKKQQSYLFFQKSMLQKFSDSLSASRNLLNKQYLEIKNGRYFLDSKLAAIDSINREIEERNKILSSKDNVIEHQSRIMQLLYIAIAISIMATIATLLVLRLIRKKNAKLVLQKERIDYMNAQLIENNEELQASLDEVKLMQKQLIQSEKMASLGVLSAGIAHEINNPINFVYAGINSLLRDFKDIEPVIEKISQLDPNSENLREQLLEIEKLKEENYYNDAIEAIPSIINDIKIGADRTAEIVKGLRRFSRTDQGSLVPYDLHDGLETSLLLLRNKYKNHVQIVREYDPEMPELMCFAGKLNQVFLNIISNAIDAVSQNGQIIVKTAFKDPWVEISIKDNGCGMDKAMLAKLFDPFFTTKPVGQGTGLGLSITYGIIKEHNGKIEVFSELNVGTEFIITIPKQ